MANTSYILCKPKIKSSAGDTINVGMYSILYDNNNICSQCGHDHSHKITGGSAIEDMISYLDRDRSKEI